MRGEGGRPVLSSSSKEERIAEASSRGFSASLLSQEGTKHRDRQSPSLRPSPLGGNASPSGELKPDGVTLWRCSGREGAKDVADEEADVSERPERVLLSFSPTLLPTPCTSNCGGEKDSWKKVVDKKSAVKENSRASSFGAWRLPWLRSSRRSHQEEDRRKDEKPRALYVRDFGAPFFFGSCVARVSRREGPVDAVFFPGTLIAIPRWFLLCMYAISAFVTGCTYFDWPAFAHLLFRSGAFSWQCARDAAGHFVTDFRELSGDTSSVKPYICDEQDALVARLFTVAQVSESFMCIVSGFLLDSLSPLLVALLGQGLNSAGWILLACSSESFPAYIPAMICIGCGTETGYLPLVRIARLFPGHAAVVITFIGAANSGGFAVPLILIKIWDAAGPTWSFVDLCVFYICLGPLLSAIIAVCFIPYRGFSSVREGDADCDVDGKRRKGTTAHFDAEPTGTERGLSVQLSASLDEHETRQAGAFAGSWDGSSALAKGRHHVTRVSTAASDTDAVRCSLDSLLDPSPAHSRRGLQAARGDPGAAGMGTGGVEGRSAARGDVSESRAHPPGQWRHQDEGALRTSSDTTKNGNAGQRGTGGGAGCDAAGDRGRHVLLLRRWQGDPAEAEAVPRGSDFSEAPHGEPNGVGARKPTEARHAGDASTDPNLLQEAEQTPQLHSLSSVTTESAGFEAADGHLSNELHPCRSADEKQWTKKGSGGELATPSVNMVPLCQTSAFLALSSSSGRPTFFSQLFSKHFLCIAIYSSVTSVAIAFLQSASSRVYTEEVSEVAEVVLCFTFVPCVFLGWVIDSYGSFPTFLLMNTMGLISIVCATMSTSSTIQYVSVAAFCIHVSIDSEQIFCYVQSVFRPEHFGKISGAFLACDGFFSLLAIPLYDDLTVRFLGGDVRPVSIGLAAALVFCYAPVIAVWVFQQKHPDPYGVSSPRSGVESRENLGAADKSKAAVGVSEGVDEATLPESFADEAHVRGGDGKAGAGGEIQMRKKRGSVDYPKRVFRPSQGPHYHETGQEPGSVALEGETHAEGAGGESAQRDSTTLDRQRPAPERMMEAEQSALGLSRMLQGTDVIIPVWTGEDMPSRCEP
ncbi:hypothetical protein BESB_000920 [Besnoitia besnoiti]|uniref:Transporter, major facilitator family protein n=1 Tax=Besnoitia besnoiti TaxID=94643 RepID=A0A2A9MPI5_BESBE|nr:hypothetical protein BESB_000920 [Besnoitia besnoiti]PFH37750.1 hypothetical protein BESB_000920 [Besnoitia besnoiti]